MLAVNSAASLADLALRPAQGAAQTASAAPVGQDFANLLGRLAAGTADTLQQGESAAIAGMQGGLPLQTVVERVMAAERTLQAALAVRDKAVGAYQEINRMQI